MRPKMRFYENHIRMKYQIFNRENAYDHNRGYIMGLSDGKAISTSEGMQLIDLNGLLRRKPVQ